MPDRSEWRARWIASLREWWTLIERGELIYFGPAQVVAQCGPAFTDAFRRRFGAEGLRAFVRGPLCPLATLAATAAVLGVVTRGFSATRALLASVQAWYSGQPPVREDALVGQAFSLAFAFCIGMGVATLQRLTLRWYGWRYWSFFLWKTGALFLVAGLLWIEGGTAFRARVPAREAGGVTANVAFWLLAMAACAIAMGWSFRDQRRRCPVCLRRLSLPVTIGSWGSVLEPVIVELVCDSGHGSLWLTETAAAGPDRWTVLGPSWQDLFERG